MIVPAGLPAGFIPSRERGVAFNPSFSAFPGLWNGLFRAFLPSLGFQSISTLRDYSPQHTDGTMTGFNANDWNPVKNSQAIRFQTSRKVVMGTGIISLDADFSIHAVVNLDDMAGNTYCIAGASVAGDTTKPYFKYLYRNDKAGFTFEYDLGPGSALFCTNPSRDALAPRYSHSLVLVRDHTNGIMHLWQDGTCTVDDTTNPTFGSPNTTQQWDMGQFGTGATSNHFQGRMGVFLLYNRALTREEARTLSAYPGAPFIPIQSRPALKFPLVAPTVTTTAASSVTALTASCGGNVTAGGTTSVTARGVAYGTSPSPTVGGSHTSDGTGTGSFTSSLSGLTPLTTYYVRAYATNSVGTSYGAEEVFSTLSAAQNLGMFMGIG